MKTEFITGLDLVLWYQIRQMMKPMSELERKNKMIELSFIRAGLEL